MITYASLQGAALMQNRGIFIIDNEYYLVLFCLLVLGDLLGT